jgi:hypothetical protein
MGRFGFSPNKKRYDDSGLIYGDSSLGRYDELAPRADEHVDTRSWEHTKFPPEYWEEYEQLRTDAQRKTKAADVSVVVRLDGKYHVQGYLPARGKVLSTPHTDRLSAWKMFINEFGVA